MERINGLYQGTTSSCVEWRCLRLTKCTGAAFNALRDLEFESQALIFVVEAGYFAVNINQPWQVELQKVMGLRAVGE